MGVEGVSLDDYITADEHVVAKGVPTDDDLIASVQPTESTPPTLQEDKFDNNIDNCGEEFIPPSTEEAQKAAQPLWAYFSSKRILKHHYFTSCQIIIVLWLTLLLLV